MDKIRKKLLFLDKGKRCDIDRDKLEEYGLTGVVLRDYQVEGVRWLIDCYQRKHGCILGDEMGLGKTCQTISLLIYLHGCGESCGPHFVISPLSVLNNWRSELSRIAPHMKVMSYVGNKEERPKLQSKIKTVDYNIVLTTYEICLKDVAFLKQRVWHTLVVDEGHRLKNRTSLLHQALLDFSFEHKMLLTGTPVQNNMSELYSLLCFVAPHIFPEIYMEDFVQEFSDIKNIDYSSNSTQIFGLHTRLRPFILRRIKTEVLKDLPQKTEVIIYHGLSKLQKKYYKAILTKDTDAFDVNSHKVTKTRLSNILMQLRKCVDHPYLFDGVEPEPFMLGEHLVEASEKLVLLDRLLNFLKSKGHKVLLFSQMTRMLDIIQDYLGYRGYTYERLDGSVRGEERYLAVQSFNEDDSTFIFLLSTKAGGVGLNLTAADTVVFIDSDFNPQNDLQAAARAHRIGQTRDVKIIRLIGRNTVEEIILSRAEAKLKLTSAVIEAGQFTTECDKSPITDDTNELADVLKFGLDKLFNEENSDSESVDFTSILGQTIDGQWVTESERKKEGESASLDAEAASVSEAAPQSMYMFEGTDYSKETSSLDQKAFEKLMEDEKLLQQEMLEESKVLRRTKTGKNVDLVFPELRGRTRKQLTPEEIEQRKIKRAETLAKRAKEAEEAERKKEERRKERKAALWKKHNYSSKNISLDSAGESDSDSDTAVCDDDDKSRDINYLVGDVTHPQNTYNKSAIIVHCVDDSGHWGSGGLFSALDARSMNSEEAYTKAGEMKDLSLSDCHLVKMNGEAHGSDDTADTKHYVALVVAQTRDRHNNLSGINLLSLSTALQRIYKSASQMKASVHLPRIGHNTPGFNWYGTERLIRKHLASKGVPTFIIASMGLKTLNHLLLKNKGHILDRLPQKYYPRKRALGKDGKDGKGKVPPAKRTRISIDVSDDEEKSDEDEDGTSQGNVMSRLPDYFKSVRAFFKDVPAQEKKQYKRYLIAYDGDVEETLTPKVTHVIVQTDCDLQETLKKVDRGDAVVVTTAWLDQCIKKSKLLSSSPFELQI